MVGRSVAADRFRPLPHFLPLDAAVSVANDAGHRTGILPMPRSRQDVGRTTLKVSHNPTSRSEVAEIILGIGKALAQQAARDDFTAEQAKRKPTSASR